MKKIRHEFVVNNPPNVPQTDSVQTYETESVIDKVFNISPKHSVVDFLPRPKKD